MQIKFHLLIPLPAPFFCFQKVHLSFLKSNGAGISCRCMDMCIYWRLSILKLDALTPSEAYQNGLLSMKGKFSGCIYSVPLFVTFTVVSYILS